VTLGPSVEFRGIVKRFGAAVANDGVSLAIPAGTIHAVIGENGAGKTTLVSLLAGLLRPDEGEILLAGRPVRLASPADAIAAGIGMVHQHFMLAEALTVLENLMLGAEGGWRLAAGRAAMRARLARLASAHGLALDPDARIGDLPVGLRQRAEILKALTGGARILILDEPTAVLTPQEADELFRIVRHLREAGTTILLVTHKLREALGVADAITVLRAGRIVATLPAGGASEEQLADLMVGGRIAVPQCGPSRATGPDVLRIEGLRVADARGIERVRGLDLAVRAGEILGIAGVAGNGQGELLASIAGVAPVKAGRILIVGHDVTRATPRRRRALGLALIPEDRLSQGLVAEFSAAETLRLGEEGGRLPGAVALAATAAPTLAAWDVRPPQPDRTVARFSSGNQQKLLCAREIGRGTALIVAGQPTRGVDVGAAAFIHRRLLEARERGAAILLVSADLDELRRLADRLVVLVGGRIAGELDAREADDRRLGLLMGGASASP
jgi:simple sugar transport system ATP-binding protein